MVSAGHWMISIYSCLISLLLIIMIISSMWKSASEFTATN